MILPRKVIEFGLNEDQIRDHHSKTRLSNFKIDSVDYIWHTNDTILIRLHLSFEDTRSIIRHNRHRQMSLQISKSRIREKKINQLIL